MNISASNLVNIGSLFFAAVLVQTPLGIAADQSTTSKPITRDVGRLGVVAPATAWLGEPLTLHISAPGARGFHVEQVGLQTRPGYNVSESDDFDLNNPTANSTELTIIPKVFGLIRLRIVAKFADGVFDEAFSGDIQVSLNPKDFIAFRGDYINEFTSSLAISETGGGMIDPVIDVRGLTIPVDVAAFTTWRIVSPTENPPLKITSDGMMKSVHPGEELVEGTFEGHKTIVKISVEKD